MLLFRAPGPSHSDPTQFHKNCFFLMSFYVVTLKYNVNEIVLHETFFIVDKEFKCFANNHNLSMKLNI